MSDKTPYNKLKEHHLKKNIFEVPEGYFSDLTEKLIRETSNEKEGFLHKNLELKENIFSTPENYFETIINYLEERQAIEYELLSSVEGLDAMLDNMIFEETSSYSFALNENPELDYDFEYFDH